MFCGRANEQTASCSVKFRRHTVRVPATVQTETNRSHFLLKATIGFAWIVSAVCFFCVSVRRPMVRRGTVIRGPKPLAVRWPPANKVPVGRGSQATNVPRSEPRLSAFPPSRSWQARRGPRSSIGTSDEVAGGDCEFGTRRSRGEEGVGCSIEEGQTQVVAPPVEDRIAQSMKFIERAKKRLAVADEFQSAVQKKS